MIFAKAELRTVTNFNKSINKSRREGCHNLENFS